MRQVAQTLTEPPSGNGPLTCAVSVSGMPLGEVPNPHEQCRHQVLLAELNLTFRVWVGGDGTSTPRDHSILSAQFPRGSFTPAVIGPGCKVVRGPHP